MSTLHVKTREGEKKSTAAQSGFSVMEILRDGGFDEILALCGGSCSCATCHVYVEEARLHLLPPLSDDEENLLDGSSHRKANSRLSCQLPWSDSLDGLHVTIPPED